MLPGVLILLSVMISVTALYIGMTAFPDGMKAKCYTRLFRNQTGKLYSAFPLVLHILTVRGSIAICCQSARSVKALRQERDCLFTREEQKTMMTLWCMFRSPLMIGAELTKMDDFTLSLLTNKELLVLLSEDFRGEQLRRSDGEADWKNTSTKTGMITAALFNLSDTDREICSNMEELSGREPDKDSYEFTELWSGEVLHSGKEALTVVVPAHGTKVFSVR